MNILPITRVCLVAVAGAVAISACTVGSKPEPVVSKPVVRKPNTVNVAQARRILNAPPASQNAYAEAVALLRPEAELGHAEAQYLLATAYQEGKGIARDPVNALQWFESAARRGSVDAAMVAHERYSKGIDVPASRTTAMAFLKMAADGGLAEAQYDLANAYLEGNGVRRDPASAVAYFEMAAEQGVIPAVVYVAEAYETGKGVPEDRVWAMRWHERAANFGIVESQVKFGSMIWSGDGMPVNQSEGMKWLLIASDAGSKAARKTVQRFRRRMSRADFRAGQEAAEIWKAQTAGTATIVDTATVRFVQASFNQIGIPIQGINGRNDLPTRQAVESFRDIRRLGPGGEIDLETVYAIRDFRLETARRAREFQRKRRAQRTS